MITRIELDGFKTFKNFAIDLAPFQVIIGANGSGKSNLFDALQLLSRLATYDLREAFQGLRGSARELFTRLPDGTSLTSMRLAVELLLDRKVKDDAGREVELKYTRLRYEIGIAYAENARGPDKLRITHEALRTIPREGDAWIKGYNVPDHFLPEIPANDEAMFIGTGTVLKGLVASPLDMNKPIITAYRVGQFQRVDQFPGNLFEYVAEELPRTLLSLIMGADFLPISAAREEMRRWRLVHLSPEELRKPGAVTGPRLIDSQGGNLPTMLAYMQEEDEFALARVSSDLTYMVPDIDKIEIREDAATNTYRIWVSTRDQRDFSANLLSDGTLRLLALATIKNDLQFHGVLCLEEPENGVNTLNLGKMTRLLKLLATDFADIEQGEEPFMQVIITTHSPLIASQPEALDALLFAYAADLISSIEGKRTSLGITLMAPVVTPDKVEISTENRRMSREVYTIDQVTRYLAGDTLDTARKQLEEARKALNER